MFKQKKIVSERTDILQRWYEYLVYTETLWECGKSIIYMDERLIGSKLL